MLPLRTTVVSVSATLTAGPIAEANVKPVTKLSLTASDMDASKASALIAMSAELVRSGTPAAMALVERELRTAIARATNQIFLPIITTGITFVASSGVQATGVRQDLRTLLSLVNSGADSKLFLIVTRKIAEAWAVLPDVSGAAAFPTATVNGGSIGGIPIIVCDEATDGEIILVDSSQVAAGTEGFVLDSSTEATLDLSSPGDSPADCFNFPDLALAAQLGSAQSGAFHRRETFAFRCCRQDHRRKLHWRLASMTVTTLERKQFTDAQLMEVFGYFKREYGDIGLAIAGMHLELKQHVAQSEARVAELEQRKRR